MFTTDLNFGASNPAAAYMQGGGTNGVGTMPTWGNMTGFGGVQAGMGAGAGAVSAPGGIGGANSGLGMNLGTGQLVLGGIQAIGNLWAAWEAQKLAKEQFSFQKDMTNANFSNQLQSYNTTLSDKINSRSFTEGRAAGFAENYINENKLVDNRANK